MNKTLILGAAVVGVICLGISVLYFLTPAGSLPAFMPGFETGVTVVHTKHAVGALVLALALFAFAWFRSGPKRA
jgi:hypothetical protein